MSLATEPTIQIWRLAQAPQVLLTHKPASVEAEWLAAVSSLDDATWFEALLRFKGEHSFVKYQPVGEKVLYFFGGPESWNFFEQRTQEYRTGKRSTFSRPLFQMAE